MSVISTIYTNLAAMSVTVGSTTPTVYLTGTLPKTLDTVRSPCRVLDPSYGPDSARFDFIAHSGNTAAVHWTIYDVLLWKAEGQDLGPLAVAANLVTYCGAYAEAVRLNRGIVAGGQSEIQVYAPVIRFDINWPRGSSGAWYGVEVRLEIMEVLSGA